MKLAKRRLQWLYEGVNKRYNHPAIAVVLHIIIYFLILVFSIWCAETTINNSTLPILVVVTLWTIFGSIFCRNICNYLEVTTARKKIVVLIIGGPHEIIWWLSEDAYPTVVDYTDKKLNNIFSNWKKEDIDSAKHKL